MAPDGGKGKCRLPVPTRRCDSDPALATNHRRAKTVAFVHQSGIVAAVRNREKALNNLGKHFPEDEKLFCIA